MMRKGGGGVSTRLDHDPAARFSVPLDRMLTQNTTTDPVAIVWTSVVLILPDTFRRYVFPAILENPVQLMDAINGLSNLRPMWKHWVGFPRSSIVIPHKLETFDH